MRAVPHAVVFISLLGAARGVAAPGADEQLWPRIRREEPVLVSASVGASGDAFLEGPQAGAPRIRREEPARAAALAEAPGGDEQHPRGHRKRADPAQRHHRAHHHHHRPAPPPAGPPAGADPARHHHHHPAAAWSPPAGAASSAGIPASAGPATGANQSASAAHAGVTGPGEQARPKTDDDGPFFMKLGFLGRVVGLLVLLQLLAAVAFEWSHQRWSGVDVNEPLPSVPEGQRPSVDGLFAGFRHLAAPYFTDPRNTKGRFCCYTIVALGLLGLFLAYVHNLWHKEWWDLFQKGDSSRFPSLMGIYIVIVVAVVLSRVYANYVRSWLYIDWREHMTQRLAQRWLLGHTHFLMQVGPTSRQHVQRVDNPDQRLQEDVNLFVNSALDICPNFLNSAGSLFVFVPVVLSNEPQSAFGVPGVHFPGWLLAMAVAYSFVGAMCTHFIGWPMITYSYARQRYEADFRNLAIHIRDNSQSVALYNSEATERSSLQRQFDRIKLVQWRQMILEKRLSFFTSAYDYVQFLVPFFILAPSYFKKEISLGDLFQLTGAIGSVANSFDWFMRIYGPLSDWRATADRLLSFERAILDVHAQASRGKLAAARAGQGGGGPEQAGERDWLRADIARVDLPSGETLWRDVSIAVKAGQRLLISGPEGTGKSVLFKALAGIWPHTAGSEVHLPARSSDVLFVPQRPALPKRCTLAEALAYPEAAGAYKEEALLQALCDVRLEELAVEGPPSDASTGTGPPSDSGSLCEAKVAPPPDGRAAEKGHVAEPEEKVGLRALRQVDEWSSRLSPGQQQRLAFGHALLRKPRVLFLDEATSNVSKQAALELYETATRQLDGATIVSISHDVATLEPLHDVHVAVKGEGAEKELVVLKGDSLASSSSGAPAANSSSSGAPAAK